MVRWLYGWSVHLCVAVLIVCLVSSGRAWGQSQEPPPINQVKVTEVWPDGCINLAGKYSFQGKELTDIPNYFRVRKISFELPYLIGADPLPKEARGAFEAELLQDHGFEIILRDINGLVFRKQIPLRAAQIECSNEQVVLRFSGKVSGEGTREEYVLTKTLSLDHDGALKIIIDRESRELFLFFSFSSFHERFGARFPRYTQER